MDSAVIGATVAVGEGQDLLNLEDPVVIKLQSTRIQQKLVSSTLVEAHFFVILQFYSNWNSC